MATNTAYAAPAPAHRATVALLDVEPDFATGLPPDDLEVARRVLTTAEIRIAAGPWDAPDGDGVLGYLIVDGALAHEVLIAGDRTMQLLGPGDVVMPSVLQLTGAPARHAWRALEEVRLAPLDGRFSTAARKWPSLGVVLHRRLAAQAMRASVHTALAQLGRVELRVLAILWHLVDRWGSVTPDGVVVRLRLTHESIGRLVGARRPTVTLALKELGSAGMVARRDDGLLVLDPASRDVLGPADG